MADKAGAMQVFLWHGQGAVKEDGRTYYQTFSLNGVQYQIGDFVYLYPENDDDYPHYIGQIQKAFVDASANLQDPHCIEIKWFERRTNLEPTTKGIEESEKEVFELDDTDINPIGCISGKCTIIRATHYEHAWHRMKEHDGVDWYFCRGYFRQATNSFEAYTPEEIGEQPSALLQPFQGPQQTAQPSASQQPQGHSVQRAYQSGYNHSPASQQQLSFEADADDLPASKRKATGRACLQCGATSTPQWREGPEGPKTLCNACGVRYVRSLQKGGQRKASASGQVQQARSTPTAATQKNLQGSLKEASTTPQAPQSSTVASPKARQSGQRTNARKSVVPKDTTLAQQRSPSAMQKAELCKPQAAGSKSNSSSSSATVAKNVGTAARVKHVAVA